MISDLYPFQPQVAIYAGKGSSHSWLWFMQLCEAHELYNLDFLTETEICSQDLKKYNAIIISGGETFEIARALGIQGARSLRRGIESGSTYIGSCAGAYLPMYSSKEPLHYFNFAPVTITNLSKHLPRIHRMEQKSYACYGCRFIFHPVREEVILEETPAVGHKVSRVLAAPLYGGPGMEPREGCQTLFRYKGFTAKTSFLVDQELAEQTLLGKAAAVRCRLGRGSMYLLGPHFEHPAYAKANSYLTGCLYSSAVRAGLGEPDADVAYLACSPGKDKSVKELKRNLSNSRIMASGLEQYNMFWKLGQKTIEPEKIRVYLEAIWKRMLKLERLPYFAAEKKDTLTEEAQQVTSILRELRQALQKEQDTQPIAERLFQVMPHLTAQFMGMYFQSLSFLKSEQASNVFCRSITAKT